MELSGSTPFIAVRVNDQGPFWFILDTGANSCVLADSLAEALGLKPLDDGVGSSGGTPMGYRKYAQEAAVYQIGATRCTCEHTISVDLSGQPAVLGRRVDGILGSDFIAQFVIEMDYDAMRVVFRDTTGYEYHGDGVIVPLEFQKRIPVLTAEIQVGDREPALRKLVVDTGSQDAVDDSLVLHAPSLREVVGGGGQGERYTMQLGRLDLVRIAGFEFRNVPSVASRVQIVGGEVLQRFRIILDYPRRRMILEPGSRLEDPFPSD